MRQRVFVISIAVVIVALVSVAMWAPRPLRAPAVVNDLARPESNTRERPAANAPTVRETAPTRAEPEQPADGTWLIRGRIVFTAQLEPLVPRQDDWNQEAHVWFLPQGREPHEAVMLTAALDARRAFSQEFTSEQLELDADQPVPPGTWQVLYGQDGNTAPSLYDLDETPLAGLKGVVTPRISGRVIDFGDVIIDEDAFFYAYVTLRGRLMHTSGRALAHSSDQHLRGDSGGDDQLSCDFRTAADGSFTALYRAGAPREPSEWAKYVWTIAEGSYHWDDYSPEAKAIAAPTWTGRHADFGVITIGGALVEIVLTGIEVQPLLDESGDLKREAMNSTYLGPSVFVNFEGDGKHHGVHAFSHPQVNLCVLPEGRYLWEARAEADGFFPGLNGVIVVEDGHVHRLELDLTPFASIPLLVRKGDEKSEFEFDECWVKWEVKREDEVLHSGSDYYGAASRVPVVEGCETEVEVRCFGFEDAVATARTGMPQIEIVLVSDTPPEMPEIETATLIVTGAAGPPGKSKSSLRAVLEVKLLHYARAFQDSDWGEEAIEHEFTLTTFGTGTVTLRGGKEWGYPDGVLAGPVEFAIAPGETRSIELPAIASPPWALPVTRIKVKPYASGAPLEDLHTWLRYEGMPEPEKAAMFRDGQIDAQGWPTAVTDGRDDYTVEFTPAENGVGTLRVDLPHTIEVRVVRNGQPMEKIRVWAKSEDVAAPDLPVQCSGHAIDGVAKLWVPRGLANIWCWVGNVSYSRKVEVTPGQVVLVDIAVPLLELTVDVAGDPYYSNGFDFDVPDLWRLQAAAPDGSWVDLESLSETTTLMLGPGSYRAVPWNGGEPVAIELQQDKAVKLPAIARPVFGSAILKFDVALLGEHEVGLQLKHVLTAELKPNKRYFTSREAPAEVVAQGIRLTGLPIGAELAIWGHLQIRDGKAEPRLLLRPLKVKLAADGQVVEAEIRQEVILHEEWEQFDASWVTPVENLTPRVIEGTMPGRQEILIYGAHSGRDNRSILHREWVVVPETSTEPFRIPATLRRELEARNLLRPIEDDE